MPIPLKNGELLRHRYQVKERIGHGGSGNIYLAEDQRLQGRLCALKEVEYDQNLPKKIIMEARQQFLREATILARLDHPNLPKVSDFFSRDIRDYLVMDFVPGKDLRQVMMEARQQKSFLKEVDVLGWANQLANALTYLHTQTPPIIHRDIKPSNLKLTPNGLLKLVDFGLVKVMAPDEVTITIVHGQGTALYTPLEQYGGDDSHTDLRSDIYAFGATIYHMLTNQSPVDARRRFLDPLSLTSPSEINPEISPRTERAILKAMSLHPDERPESVEEFRQMLLGRREVVDRPITGNLPQKPVASWEWLTRPPETFLAWLAAALTFVSLVATLTH
ncbi:MAG: serine/threonine protein kinase [Anaerolineales bacterium]|nr:serine/threonine protein kinase [Anaerolineales bacterium]